MSQPVAITLEATADYDEWRDVARKLLAAGVAPDQVSFRLAGSSGDLFGSPDFAAGLPAARPVRVPRRFKQLAQQVICHSDDSRFAVLYRLLWRLREQPALLNNAADTDVCRARQMARAVRRDTHKMKAFVRFRRAVSDAGEIFMAWFEPDHHIVERTAPFFARRFAAMRWSIVTPGRSAHWDGEQLTYGVGATRRDCPNGDALEEHWRVYYSSIFNPARLKVKAMKTEMPARYWRNLPESRLIPELIRSGERAQRAAPAGTAPSVASAQRLVARQPGMETSLVDTPRSLAALAARMQRCTRCDLCHAATAAVPGEGPLDARLMIVGEQPGDREDLTGRPFVGPAGAVLDEAMGEAEIRRQAVYLTNAVKHFKYTLRGKQRIHQRPNAAEVEACRWWLGLEREIVAPSVIVALGATAARAVSGRAVRLADVRGKPFRVSADVVAIATIHPAFLLRLPHRDQARIEREQFVDDLRLAATIATNGTEAADTADVPEPRLATPRDR